MFFDLSDDQELLRDSVRGFLARRDLARATHARTELSAQYRRSERARTGDQGLAGAMLPERLGGSGASAVEAVVIAEEFGRAADCGNFAGGVAAAQAILSGNRNDQEARLRRLGQGHGSVAWACASLDQCTGELKASVDARAAESGLILEGTVRLVQDADIADALLVDAGVENEFGQFLVDPDLPGVRIKRVDCVDISRAFFDVSFDRVLVTPGARLIEGDATTAIETGLGLAAVLASADSVGAAAKTLDMTVAYVKERVAFGKPIGSFQAIKHRCARMLVLVEAARVAVWKASVAVGDDPQKAAEAISAAKFYASDAALAVASDALQLHGGIGMTWELDLHVLLKRIRTNGALWGAGASHRERVSRHLGLR